jgi:DNA polymerase II large subunit
MQGVLSEIQNQKSQKDGVVARVIANSHDSVDKTMLQKSSKEGSLSKFESYVRNVCNLRQDSKVIILRKAKTKSLVAGNSHSAIRSTAILNVHKFDTIREAKPKEIAPYDPRKRRERPYF